jgi:hypothetical protein
VVVRPPFGEGIRAKGASQFTLGDGIRKLLGVEPDRSTTEAEWFIVAINHDIGRRERVTQAKDGR